MKRDEDNVCREEEAQKKYCPIIKGKCVGSLCMMWLWVTEEGRVTDIDLGYCGMSKSDW